MLYVNEKALTNLELAAKTIPEMESLLITIRGSRAIANSSYSYHRAVWHLDYKAGMSFTITVNDIFRDGSAFYNKNNR